MTRRNATSCEWTVTGIDCGSCAGKVRGALERLPGVADVDVALMAERLRITLDEDQTSRDHVEAAVKKLTQGRLLFICQAFQTLLEDDHFVILLRAEGLETMPSYLQDFIAEGAAP